MTLLRSARELAAAYRRGETTPSRVLKAVLDGIRASDRASPELNAFIFVSDEDARAAARLADERLRDGRPLGPLDGIPVAVKDELHVAGAPTTIGTRIFGGRREPEDATCVARLRAAGAIVVGKTGMHEIGGGATGINPHHGPVRNPWDPSRVSGGSSSGSAAAVGAGLVPLALGTDAGGSVRIPACLCGVTGYKPTFGAVSRRGMPRMIWSLDHIGLLAHTAADVADALRVIAGPDEHDPDTQGLPATRLDGIDAGVGGLRLGVVRSAVDACPAEVASPLRAMIGRLREAGARTVDVEVEHLGLAQAMGVVILGCEGASAYEEDFAEHRERFGAEMRLLLEAARHVPAVDYLRAQRVRSLLARSLDDALERCDALVLPTIERTAAPIRDAALAEGEVDEELAASLARFTFAANLAGLPSGTTPCGFDAGGLPVGLQVIGRAFDEATVLRVMAACEPLAHRGRSPRIAFDLLAT
jgi:Asp-tRNA(Asn)/Glu-tRNA(Gln) amidotransferase A subunit family amidase